MKTHTNPLKFKQLIKNDTLKSALCIVLGACILSFGTYNFNYQNSVTEGGILGLLLLVKNLLNISPSITSVVLDFSLFFLGARFYGKKFLLFSFLSTTTFSLSYRFFESIGPIVPSLTNHMLFASILAGLFVGVGVGIIVRAGGASGGDDVIALLVSKFTPLKVHQVYLLTDITVLFLSLAYLSFYQIFWSLIAVTISGKVISLIYYQKEPEEPCKDNVDESSPTLPLND